MLSDLLAVRFGTESIRYALVLAGVANLGAALHYLLAARTLRQDLLAKER